MACKSLTLRGALPICEMSLRPLPSDTLPGDHLVLIAPDRWRAHLQDEECLCDTPHLEWCLTPLGAAAELSWGSASHRLCASVGELPRDLVLHAHPGIAAEAVFAAGDISAFLAFVLESPRAAQHVLSLAYSFVDAGLLAEAQQCVRAAWARAAAEAAIREFQ